MASKIWFDFEVFPKWYCFVYTLDGEKFYLARSETIKQDLKKLQNRCPDDDLLWIGYNSRSYDNLILAGVYKDFDVDKMYELNRYIIHDSREEFKGMDLLSAKGLAIKKVIDKYDLRDYYKIDGYDLIEHYLVTGSLKEKEAMLDMNIQETSIPFDQVELTEDDKKEIVKYCKHDVLALKKLYDYVGADSDLDYKVRLRDEFRSEGKKAKAFDKKNKMFVNLFNLDHNTPDFPFDNPCEKFIPDIMKVFEFKNFDKERMIKACNDLFDNYKNSDFNEEKGIAFWSEEVNGDLYEMKQGGIHFALNNFYSNERLWDFDVGSMYPSIMRRFDLLSRKMKDDVIIKDKNGKEIHVNMRTKFFGYLDERLQIKQKMVDAKHAGDMKLYKRLKSQTDDIKVILNSIFGVAKTKGPCYDESYGLAVCVAGQLIDLGAADLLISMGAKIFQLNTDGIFFQTPEGSNIQDYKDALLEKFEALQMTFELETIKAIAQKDVLNYVYVDQNDGLKARGQDLAQKNGWHLYVVEMLKKKLLKHAGYDYEPKLKGELREFKDILKLPKQGKAKNPIMHFEDESGNVLDLDKFYYIYAMDSNKAIYKRMKSGELKTMDKRYPAKGVFITQESPLNLQDKYEHLNMDFYNGILEDKFRQWTTKEEIENAKGYEEMLKLIENPEEYAEKDLDVKDVYPVIIYWHIKNDKDPLGYAKRNLKYIMDETDKMSDYELTTIAQKKISLIKKKYRKEFVDKYDGDIDSFFS